DGQVVAGSAESITASLVGNAELATLGHVSAPATIDPELAWQAASKTDTPAAYLRYKQRFAQSPHAAESAQRASAILARDAQREAAVDVLRGPEPELATQSETQLTVARGRLTTRLLGEGKTAAAARDFPTASLRFATALTIAIDLRAVEKARTAAFESAVRAG